MKLGYICKYTPIEVLEACGARMRLLKPRVSTFHKADARMHANLCSYVRAVFEVFEESGLDGLVLTSCCDSARRLYDALTAAYPGKFFYMLDLPRKVNEFTESLYARQVMKMEDTYCRQCDGRFDPDLFVRICREKRAKVPPDPAPARQRIILTGARPDDTIRELLRARGCAIVLDLTCTGAVRSFPLPDTDTDSLMRDYIRQLLNQIPCMRMAKGTNRQHLLDEMAGEADGIICHTMKFCDIYNYEYTALREKHALALLKLETDCTSESSGQILTRIEAFLESLDAADSAARDEACATQPSVPAASRDGNAASPAVPDQTQPSVPAASRNGDAASPAVPDQTQPSAPAASGEAHMYILGIDSGSTSTNAVLIDENKTILAYSVQRTGAKSIESARRVRGEVLRKAGLTAEQIRLTVSTGYGRVSIPFADMNVTEISCHGKGAHLINPAVRTILDIGGQDSKAIRLNEHGDVADFVMNDKCAAGTGRFLEMMARTLEISIEELGRISLESKEAIKINSMCSVFAESEVISLIAQNKEAADIAHGVHEAIVNRCFSLLRRVGPEPVYMMTGGVAKNPGVAAILREKLQAEVCIYEEPEIVGAIGAAISGLEKVL